MTSSTPAQKRSIAVICATADTKSAQAVSNFISQLGMAPSLHSTTKATGDAAALEVLESARGAEYAIVLAGEGANITPLQIGFLLGCIGRNRLCFLGTAKSGTAAGVESMPRHDFDASGLWKLLLARDMKAAGMDVDLNRAI
jgi:hypothetical protein